MPSIISEKMKARSTSPRSLPVSGHLRSGTQILIRSAENLKGAQALFEKAATGAISFKDAEKQILDQNNGSKKAFAPKNTQYFNVYAHETEGGQVSVDNIMGRFAEIREGDPRARLYEVPVVFPPTPDGVDGFFKSEYSMAVGAVKYRSEYGDDGIRRCVYLKPVDAAEQAKRKKFLRREPTTRKNCEPGECAEFGSGACKFRGRLHFHVPGVIGSGMFVFETGSVNASEDIFLRLEDLHKSMGGKLPMFDPNGNPVFFLTKERRKVTYFEGVDEKVGYQWQPVLKTSLIKSSILFIEERKRLQLTGPTETTSSMSVPSTWTAQDFKQNDDAAVATNLEVSTSNRVAMQEELHKLAKEKPVADIQDAEVLKRAYQGIPATTTVHQTGSSNPAAIQGVLAVPANPQEALMALLKLGDENQLPIPQYGQAKYGADWDDDKNIMDLHKDMVEMFHAFGGVDSIREFLPLMIVLLTSHIPSKEVAFPYFKVFFGEFKKRHVPDAIAHVNELLKSGPVVALAHMKGVLKKSI